MLIRIKRAEEVEAQLGRRWRSLDNMYWGTNYDKFLGTIIEVDPKDMMTMDAAGRRKYIIVEYAALVQEVWEQIAELEF